MKKSKGQSLPHPITRDLIEECTFLVPFRHIQQFVPKNTFYYTNQAKNHKYIIKTSENVHVCQSDLKVVTVLNNDHYQV